MVFGGEIEEPRGGQVAWSDQLETGVDILDQQHSRYIELLNDYLGKAAGFIDDERKARQLVESFEFLRAYAEEHFSAEESIMIETAFPDFATHREEHQRFITHVDELARQMENTGFSAALAREVNFYAIEWFIDHILDSDMKLAKFLKDRNLENKASELAG